MEKKIIILTERDYMDKRKEGDGICLLCWEWSLSAADPAAENVYCHNCENRSVMGVVKARTLGYLQVEGFK